jgi:hypothetical protein
LLFVFAPAWIEAAAFAHALPEALALVGAHVPPAIGETIRHSIGHAIGHTVTHATGVTLPAAVESKSPEEDPANGQHCECLPETQQGQTE